jgi:hypothetical protein
MMARSTAIVPPETAMRFKFLDVKVFSFSFNIADVVKLRIADENGLSGASHSMDGA